MRSISTLFTYAGIATMLSCVPLTAEEATAIQNAQPSEIVVTTKKEITKEDIARLSEAFGNFIGKNLSNPGINFDLESLIVGIREGAAGKPSPMNEEEYEETLAALQEKAVEELSSDNLKKADAFLTENSKAKDIIELVPGKLQYEVLEQGEGSLVVEHSTPQLFYTGRFIDGSVFGSSEGMDTPIAIPLDQTIPGFSKGLLGMKEGERRRIFVHPDLAYGTSGQLPPNELLIFDIELVKADSPTQMSDLEEMVIGEFDDEDFDAANDFPITTEDAVKEAMTATPAKTEMPVEKSQVSQAPIEQADHANTLEQNQNESKETTAAAL